MGFLESTANLSETIFSQEDFLQAQRWLKEVITKIDPGWFKRKKGIIFQYWAQDTADAVCFLIHFADIFGALQKNITQKSVPVFIKKFKELLNEKSEKQFQELLGEMQLSRTLMDYISPIAFEPLVPQSLNKPGNKPKSPDYCIRLPDADVEIEVTTFRLGPWAKWARTNDLLKEKLEGLLKRKKISCQVAIISPLEFNSLNLLPEGFLENLVVEISQTEVGKKIISIGQNDIVLEWRPLVFFDRVNQAFGNPGKGQPISFAFGFQSRLSEADNKEVFIRSLRNILNKKRQQTSGINHYIIAIQLGHPTLRLEGLKLALQERIWPNATYKWLIGVFIFSPITGFKKTDQAPTLNYSPNPNSVQPFPQSLIEVFEGRKRYHLREGEYYSE